MKSTGVIRCVDNLGRVVLPAGMRKILEIATGDQIEVFMDGDVICFKKFYPKNSCAAMIGDVLKTIENSNETPNDVEIKQKLKEVLKLLG